MMMMMMKRAMVGERSVEDSLTQKGMDIHSHQGLAMMRYIAHMIE